MKKTNSTLAFLAFIVIVINLLSCQIGLGSSVDTESPAIAIEYPAAASCIKGEFVLAGSCSDDKGVTSVSVSITNSTTFKTYGPYEATVNSKKTSWSVNLNKASTDSSAANGWSFPDGKYEVAVVASDQAGHSSGETSRVLK
ncbi:MAG: Ig-like domain-containing protein [Treponema sp.]